LVISFVNMYQQHQKQRVTETSVQTKRSNKLLLKGEANVSDEWARHRQTDNQLGFLSGTNQTRYRRGKRRVAEIVNGSSERKTRLGERLLLYM